MTSKTLLSAALASALFGLTTTASAQDAGAQAESRAQAQASLEGQAQTQGLNAAARAAGQTQGRIAASAAQAQQQGAAAVQGAGRTSADAQAAAQAQGQVAVDRLSERYAELAGSTEAAADLVTQLHDGTGSAAAMGYGEIDLALALSESMIDSGASGSLDAALSSVQELRADGLGWGQIAKRFDLDTGSLMRASNLALGAGSARIGLAADGAAAGSAARTGVGASGAGAARVDAGGVSAGARIGGRADTRIDSGLRGGVSGAAGTVLRPVLPERPQLQDRPQRPLLGL